MFSEAHTHVGSCQHTYIYAGQGGAVHGSYVGGSEGTTTCTKRTEKMHTIPEVPASFKSTLLLVLDGAHGTDHNSQIAGRLNIQQEEQKIAARN